MINILNYIDPFFFLMAFFIGLTYTYLTAPTPKIVVKYPTPFNIKDTVYQDTNGVCYKYKIREVNCPSNKSEITSVLA